MATTNIPPFLSLSIQRFFWLFTLFLIIVLSFGGCTTRQISAFTPKQEQPQAQRTTGPNSVSSSTTTTTTQIMATTPTATAAVARSLIGKLNASQTTLLVCDLQERFRPLIYNMPTVLQTTQYMTSVASVLQIPMLVTQQYTKVFGSTIPECFAAKNETNQDWTTSYESLQASNRVFDKKLFSMMTPEVQAKLAEDDEHNKAFLLVGIEAHVCVQQTCLDLLERGKEVHIIVDGVSSQQSLDRTVALQRMQAAGAFLTTAQSAVYMLMQSAEHPQFKTIANLTVQHMKLPNQFNT